MAELVHSSAGVSQGPAPAAPGAKKAPTANYGILLLPSIGTLIAFFIVPLMIMLGYSFRRFDGPAQVGPVHYVIDNYVKFFTDLFYWEVLGRTLVVAAVVATIAVVIAYPIAYTLARSKSRWKTLMVVIVVLPLITNLVVRNYGWMVILSDNGLLNTFLQYLGLPTLTLMFTTTGVIVALTQVLTPFAVFSLFGVIQQINPQLEESVRGLGGTTWHVVKDVLIPLSWAGILAGWLLIFVQAVAAFATPLLIGGGGRAGQLLATLVFTDAISTLNWPFAAATSFIMTAIVLMLIALQGRMLRAKR
ncbi:ABC transporter permease [Aminobacter anthyllidis]|uniref:ABC transporter permease n=1 Tax=Aminobacter anthyllidis TaxID=1035067 RepID=A0A9X1AC29_9HYPH|nr:ABC transporter permease [Aminobacter anthyllidis]MBT1157165.1 ABC transporter permease [Aminobacter anthyllidis]